MGEETGTVIRQKRVQQGLKYVCMTILAVMVLVPIYYLIVTTFKTSAEATAAPMALPSSFDLSGYARAFQKNAVSKGADEYRNHHGVFRGRNYHCIGHVRICAEPERQLPVIKK